ncbi:MAG: hypothetical protein ABJF52_01585, partial [Aurantibacter sp.]
MLFSTTLLSQEVNRNSNISIADKVYLQLITKDYSIGQTIWFKAVVRDSKYHLPSQSGVLFVDLIDPFGRILEHQLLKLNNGMGNGSLSLKEEFIPGDYHIRAYTHWNLNFGEAFLFQSDISIYDEFKPKFNTYSGLKVVKKDSIEHYLLGNLAIKQHGFKGDVVLHLDEENTRDSILIKAKELKNYAINLKLNEKPNWINLRLKSNDSVGKSETIIFNDTVLDVQFFPESGELVAGLNNKIGFKAIGYDSKGRKIKGTVYDKSGNKITEFKSNHLGMGSFVMKPSTNTNYIAEVSESTNFKNKIIKQIPKVVQFGSVLSIEKRVNKINVRVASTNLEGVIYIKVSCRGNDYYLIEGPLKKSQLSAEIPTDDLPHGIIIFTLLNRDKKPIAERLYFNANHENNLVLNIISNQEQYQHREKINLDITVAKDSVPSINTDMSIMVLNKNLWQNEYENIKSYFYLSSEIHGKIEEPGYYFNSNTDRFNDLEALLLTQGWRNYKYPVQRDFNKFYRLQKALSVNGHVFSNNKKRAVGQNTITLTTFGEQTTLYSQESDSLGRFNFKLNDNYKKLQRILLSAKNNLDSKARLNITLESLKIP